jgi:formate hydrogenlyase subunit 4
MIHEVMVLDHSGPAFAMILYGASLKLLVLGALLVRLILPWDSGNPGVDAVVFMAGMLFIAVAIGVVESVMARLQLVRIPQLLIGTTMISIFALVLVLR